MAQQQQSEKAKVIVSYIAIDIIHNIDLGIRSYALFHDERYLYPYYKAIERKDSIIDNIVTLLAEQNYPLAELHVLKDSIDSYANLNHILKELIDNNRDVEFSKLANRNQGYRLWLQYERFAKHVNIYQESIKIEAQRKNKAAIRYNYTVQLLLFIICIPTLLFTTVHTFKTFILEGKLRESERQKANLLAVQNLNLEKVVGERTEELINTNRELQQKNEEIATQNEEIRSQNDQLVRQQDEIVSHRDLLSIKNDKLAEAHEIIMEQQHEIEIKNESLQVEVERKTKELLDNNQQLEQFAFISAHNLRAPVARILGLGNILQHVEHDPTEQKLIIKNIIKSTVDLDVVIKDLNTILEIKTNINSSLTQLNFSEELGLIKANLARDIWETNCTISESFSEAPTIVSVKPYLDSILFNLASNAIKYRSREKPPFINMRTSVINNFICLEVQDNGIGIDLCKYGNQVFSLYKRFHTHTEGKGLGLHLVKMQAIALGGSVSVESSPGNGSTFRVYLKIH